MFREREREKDRERDMHVTYEYVYVYIYILEYGIGRGGGSPWHQNLSVTEALFLFRESPATRWYLTATFHCKAVTTNTSNNSTVNNT